MKKYFMERKSEHFQTTMKAKSAAVYSNMKRSLLSLSVAFITSLLLSQTVFAATPGAGATDIWGWLDTALNDLYQKFLSVSTIAACVAASVCLIMMNFSTDDRAVSTSRAWLKRILVSWVVLNILGYIMVYLSGLTSGGSYVPPGATTQ